MMRKKALSKSLVHYCFHLFTCKNMWIKGLGKGQKACFLTGLAYLTPCDSRLAAVAAIYTPYGGKKQKQYAAFGLKLRELIRVWLLLKVRKLKKDWQFAYTVT
ncbi:hypothetical protein [Pantoea sp. A4]|uniref:hypothetical protein n=1 Tax=Pantoea sp. A4 TaxID=1225184 RepID=UPI00037C7031|nr:hypothetical protein [Pantoea sp. A4]